MGQQQEQERRGKRRENRHERSMAQHSGGGEWDCLRLPDGVEVFKAEKDKTYHIDVIPYIVGKYNKAADPGDEYYELSYPVYRDLGIDEKKYIAIGDFLGIKDPVAEHFAMLKKKGTEWDDMKMYKPTKRQIMLFFVHEEPEKGLQLFEGAYGTFGELLHEELRGTEDSYAINFDDPKHGATLVVRYKSKSIGQTNPWVLASKINFEEREDGFTANGDKKLAAKILAQAAEICLDDILKIPDYTTLKKALDGEPMSEEERGDEDEKPAARATRKAPADDEEEPVAKKKAPVDEDDEPKKKAAPVEDDEPVAKKKAPVEDEDEPVAKKKAAPVEEDEAPPKKKNMAEKLGIVKGDTVEHEEHGVCTVLKISDDGSTCSIMQKGGDEDVFKNIDVTDLEPVVEKKAAKAAPKDEEEDAPPAKKAAPPSAEKTGSAKTASPSKTKDDDWDDDWDDEPKKKGK